MQTEKVEGAVAATGWGATRPSWPARAAHRVSLAKSDRCQSSGPPCRL